MQTVYIILLCLLAADLQSGQKCCLPSNWQAVMTNTSQINGDVVQYFNYYYDYDLRKDAAQHVTVPPSASMYRMINDYTQGKTYIIPKEGPCVSLPNPRTMFAPCGTATARYGYMGSSYMGLRDDGIPFDVVRINDQNFSLTVAVANDSCVPLYEGVKGDFIDVVFIFSGFKSPITGNRAVFNVPADC